MKPVYFSSTSLPEVNQKVAAFVSNELWGFPDGFDRFCTMGVFSDDRLVAGTVFHNWHPESGVIELSSASRSPRWLTRPVIRAMFSMPFDQLSCRMVVLRVSEKNDTMRRIARSFGFTETVIPDLRGVGEGECVFTLSKDDWTKHKVRG